jgi:hypothetical protein
MSDEILQEALPTHIYHVHPVTQTGLPMNHPDILAAMTEENIKTIQRKFPPLRDQPVNEPFNDAHPNVCGKVAFMYAGSLEPGRKLHFDKIRPINGLPMPNPEAPMSCMSCGVPINVHCLSPNDPWAASLLDDDEVPNVPDDVQVDMAKPGADETVVFDHTDGVVGYAPDDIAESEGLQGDAHKTETFGAL